MAGDDYSAGRVESQSADAWSLMPAKRSPAAMIDVGDGSHHDTWPRYTGQPLPDFVLFPQVGAMDDKTTGASRDCASGDIWYDDVDEGRTPRSSLLPSAKRSGRKAPGTHNRARQHAESPRGRAPAMIDGHAAHARTGREHLTERIYYPPSPPNAPSIPRLPTPDFDDPGQAECRDGRHLCVCCPPCSDDGALSYWKEGRSKMDRQSKCANFHRDPTFSRIDHRKHHIVADAA